MSSSRVSVASGSLFNADAQHKRSMPYNPIIHKRMTGDATERSRSLSSSLETKPINASHMPLKCTKRLTRGSLPADMVYNCIVYALTTASIRDEERIDCFMCVKNLSRYIIV